jgi:hypothetical protein
MSPAKVIPRSLDTLRYAGTWRMFPGLSIIIGYASGVTVHRRYRILGARRRFVHVRQQRAKTGVISYRGRTLQVGDGAPRW